MEISWNFVSPKKWEPWSSQSCRSVDADAWCKRALTRVAFSQFTINLYVVSLFT